MGWRWPHHRLQEASQNHLCQQILEKKPFHLVLSQLGVQNSRYSLVSSRGNFLGTLANGFLARGTSEPGPFGVIVGDPLVKNVVAAIPSARGYAVQVCVEILCLEKHPLIPHSTQQHSLRNLSASA